LKSPTIHFYAVDMYRRQRAVRLSIPEFRIKK
jgi:hypothetical protein